MTRSFFTVALGVEVDDMGHRHDTKSGSLLGAKGTRGALESEESHCVVSVRYGRSTSSLDDREMHGSNGHAMRR